MLLNLAAKPYIIRQGDNLSLIAKNHGYRDWKVIYFSKCNQRLRQMRPNPDVIKPGDTIMLPPKVSEIRAALDQRLKMLTDLRRETDALFGGVARDLDAEFAKLQRTMGAVDTAATLLTIFKDLGFMCYNGFKSLGQIGEELAKTNKELAKDALDLAYDPVKWQNLVTQNLVTGIK